MHDLDFGQDKSDGSAHRAHTRTNNPTNNQCPHCGTPIDGIDTRGRGRHEVKPCGHRVSDAVIGSRQVAADGGQIRVQLGQVAVTLGPDDTVADLFAKATQGDEGFPPELEHTAVVRTVDNSPIEGLSPDDYVPFDLSTVHHGDRLETHLVSEDQQPVYEPDGSDTIDTVGETDSTEYEWYPTDCVLCDETSETPEEHEQHMEDVHGLEAVTDGGYDPCPSCGSDPGTCYRCQECGYDLASRNSTTGRQGGDR